MTKDDPGHVLPEHVTPDEAEQTSGPSARGVRRPYTTPQLDTYGHIQTLTLGGSPGAGESGMPSKNPLGAMSLRSNRPTRPSRPRDPARK